MSTFRAAALTLTLGHVTLGTAALWLGGCKQANGLGATGGCPVLGDCGGNPVGVWQLDPDPALSCNFPVFSRPAQNYGNTTPAFEPETGAPTPAVTSGPWCWDLTFSRDTDGTIREHRVPRDLSSG